MSILDWAQLYVAALCTLGAYWCWMDRSYLLLPTNMVFASINLAMFIKAAGWA